MKKAKPCMPAARVFYISLVFSNVRRVLSQCNTRLRLLYLLNIIIYIIFILHNAPFKVNPAIPECPPSNLEKVGTWKKALEKGD